MKHLTIIVLLILFVCGNVYAADKGVKPPAKQTQTTKPTLQDYQQAELEAVYVKAYLQSQLEAWTIRLNKIREDGGAFLRSQSVTSNTSGVKPNK